MLELYKGAELFHICLSMAACSNDTGTSVSESSVSSSIPSRPPATSKREVESSSNATSLSTISAVPAESKSQVSNNENPPTEKAHAFESYQEMLSAVESLEIYLRLKLSTEDYGGMCIWQQETVTIDLWVVNKNTVDSAVQSYSGKSVEINYKNARCSLRSLTNLSDQMKAIGVLADESLNIYVSEIDNFLAVNISKIGAKRLKEEVNSLVKSNGIPSECVVVFVIDPNEDNPVTKNDK